MGAYRKLLLQNEVISGRGANCLNDVTRVLYVTSDTGKNSRSTNTAELQLLSNYDFDNQINFSDAHFMQNSGNSLKQHSVAYVASILEDAVLRKLNNKGSKCCSKCMQIFCENEITDDAFIEYKSETNNILQPCKSTIELMNTVDNLLDKYKSLNVSFNSIMTHIVQNIDQDLFYDQSTFEQHDHKLEFLELVVNSYMNIRSVEGCKNITKMSQSNKIRHFNLKETHRAGQ